MNRELLSQVREQVLAETDKFNMSWWTSKGHNPHEVQNGEGRVDEDGISCGTTACLAGWAMTLDALNNGYTWHSSVATLQLNGSASIYFGTVAAGVLNLPVRVIGADGELGCDTCDLFLMERWPKRYQDMLEVEPGYDLDKAPAAAQAKAAAELISDLLDGLAYFDDDGKLCDLREELASLGTED